MATLTIRNVRPNVVKTLKERAKKNGKSMEQEVRDLLEQATIDRRAVLKEIEASWARQTRRPTAEEIDAWIEVGHE